MKINKLEIVFYKSNYAWWSRLIKWWTNSKYSHCELYINNEYLMGISTEQNVRIKKQELNPLKWDRVVIEDKDLYNIVNKFYEDTKGLKYDWKAIILCNIFNRRMNNKNKYTCSEWVGELIDKRYNIINPKKYYMLTPQDVYDVLNSLK